MGRARALEVALSSDDYPGELAERYGWVNRAVKDGALDGLVDTLARRIASYDTDSIAAVKQQIHRHTLPSPEDMLSSLQMYVASFRAGFAASTRRRGGRRTQSARRLRAASRPPPGPTPAGDLIPLPLNGSANASDSPCQALRSQGWVGSIQVWVHRPDAGDGDHGGLGGVGRHAVVMRGAGHAPDEGSGRRRIRTLRVEVRAAVDPPGAREHHAQSVGAVEVGRAEVPGVPLHEHQIGPAVVLAAGQDRFFDGFRSSARRGVPRDLVGKPDDRLGWISLAHRGVLTSLARWHDVVAQ